ncbi:hypothetical protein MHU86_9691 [Fragilaria crotonensis]|nr:hypothetical protein MHU86_9691 [Fragilaria crotonensis]
MRTKATKKRQALVVEVASLLRTEDGDDGQVRLILGSTTRFDGTMEDARHSSSCPPCCRDGHANRSDPSLLLGLAMTCQELRHIHIETIQLRMNTGPIDMEKDDDIAPHKDDDIAPHKDDDIAPHKDDDIAPHNDDDIAPRKVAFLITFSMPLLVEGRRGKLKALPSATQLLLSIMRSDWEYLSSGMGFEATRRFQDGGELRRDTFFPPNMSLEELYSRLRGLQTKTAKVSSRNKQSPFAMIPHEVIQTRIAPFLRARSLNAWRSTCSELHQALKAVVPGLKLVLYSHQIRSLEWMRSREVHEWTENDVIEGKCSSLSIDGDCHRCITAGATVLLRPRRTPGKVIRVNAQSGQVCEDFKSSRGSIHLSRRITRGGLLCDDPGLGKTITVLSLILQTLGLSSEEKPLSVHEQSEVIEHESDVSMFTGVSSWTRSIRGRS